MYTQDLIDRYTKLYGTPPVTGEDLWEYIKTYWSNKLFLSEKIHREIIAFVIAKREEQER